MMGDKRKAARVILGNPEEQPEKSEAESHNEMLEAIGQEMGQCIESKDWSGLVQCMKAAFRAFDAEPHEEGPHE